jgi:hypothetical protein
MKELPRPDGCVAAYADRESWSRKAIPNVNDSGKFSSNRLIARFARKICRVEPSPELGKQRSLEDQR